MDTTTQDYSEHIDRRGDLLVPMNAIDRAPKREGWRPVWVNVNLNRKPEKIVTYRRVAA